MAAFFVTGSGTDIGKTWLCAQMIAWWRNRGLEPDALKPVITGFDPSAPEGSDPALLLAALGRPIDVASLCAIAPFRLRAPLSPDQAAALEGSRLTVEAIVAACRPAMEGARGPMLIEGAGGAMSPINRHQTMLDLARALDAPVLFVAGTYLGAMSHALTGLRALTACGVRVAAAVVIQSAEHDVGLGATIDSLAGHCPGLPLIAVERGDGGEWRAELSAALGV